MKVVRNDRHTVPFSNLAIGEQFEWDGRLFVKTGCAAEPQNAFQLSGCLGMTIFASDTFVIPVEIELHMSDKK